MKILIFSLAILIVVCLTACSASTGSRYEKNEKNKNVEVKNNNENKEITEDFDITPYKTEVNIETNNTEVTGNVPSDVWYEYDNSENTLSKKIVGTTDGYRVQVLSTDVMEEANTIRSELYSKTNNKEVYVSFEPPFYKVKVGDFTSKSDADDLKFKLNQMGYSEARVVRESVNLFEK